MNYERQRYMKPLCESGNITYRFYLKIPKNYF